MRIEITDDCIRFEKEFNRLDEFVMEFVQVLDRHRIRYCIISGYVALLFGRSRSTEDVDVFIEVLDRGRFLPLWSDLTERFDCIIIRDPDIALTNYLAHGLAIRFAGKGRVIPNIEMKFPKHTLGEWTLVNRRKVCIGDRSLYISPLEIQIPYKLMLGSEKDIEDAVHLYTIFGNDLDKALFNAFLHKLNQMDLYKRYLDETELHTNS